MYKLYAFHLNENARQKKIYKRKKKSFSHIYIEGTSKVSFEKHWEVNVIFIKMWSSIKGEDLCTIMTHDIIFMKPV